MIHVEQKKDVYDSLGEKATGWLIVASVFGLLGGFFGILIGLYVFFAKIKVLDSATGKATNQLKYTDSHRIAGLVIGILSFVSIVVWNIILT